MDHHMPMPMPGEGKHDHDAMMCNMSMIWNTSTRGMCVVFAGWRVSDTTSLLATLLALFLLATLLEYLRLRIRSLDAQLISSHHLTNGILSALANPSHRRKASVQQRRHPSSVQGSAALLSSGVHSSLGGRRSPPSDSTPSSWGPSDDDAPLLPGGHARRSKNVSLFTRLRRAVVPPLPITHLQQLRRTGLYVTSVTLSMFLMLVFMTYNAWLIASVLSGAAFGHYLFSRDLGLGQLGDDKGMACH